MKERKEGKKCSYVSRIFLHCQKQRCTQNPQKQSCQEDGKIEFGAEYYGILHLQNTTRTLNFLVFGESNYADKFVVF